MKKKICYKAITVLVAFVFYFSSITTSYAIFGMGDLVSDPTSYVYYGEQLGAAAKELTEMKKQYDTLVGQLKQLQATYKAVQGAYNKAQDMYKKVKELKELMDSEPTTLQDKADKWAKIANMAGAKVNRTKLREALTTNFSDPDEVMDLMEYLAKLKKRENIKRTQVQRAIEETELILSGMPDKMESIEKLCESADEAENVNQAQQVTNQILLEMLMVLEELLKVNAHIGQAQALQYFTIPDEDYEENYKKQMAEQHKGFYKHRDELRKYGVDQDKMTDKDIDRLTTLGD